MDEIFPEFNVLPASKSRISVFQKLCIGLASALLITVIGLIWYGIQQYNELLRKDELVEMQWSHVLNQYTRRADLIPNLVSVVKSYASHENELFKEIAAARSRINSLSPAAENSRDPRAIEQFQQAQNQLAAPLARLLAIAESYPQLKADTLYRDLMVQLEGTENRITYARQRYIESVAGYNFDIRRFPNNLIARQAGYQPRARFKIENESVLSKSPQLDMK